MYRHQKACHVVLFKLPAQYGSEAILNAVHRNSGCKWKIHVSQKKFEDYLCTQDLCGSVESDFEKAKWIHACSWKDKESTKPLKPEYFLRSLPCRTGPFEVRQIRPSAMYFTQERLRKMNQNQSENSLAAIHEGGELYRVCYSCHSSLQELLDFVRHFQPKSITPIGYQI